MIKVGFLTAIVLACLIAVIDLSRNKDDGAFDQLTAHRINIVEPNGRLALVISDNANQHPGRMNGDRFTLAQRLDYLGLFLRDDKGVPQLRICVSKENKPLIQVLDDEGQPIATWDGKGK